MVNLTLYHSRNSVRTLFIICLFISGLFSQNNADIKQKIKDSGLSESQIRQMAKQRGMSDAEIDVKAQEIKGESSESEATQPVIEDIPEVGEQDVSVELPESTVEDIIQIDEQPQESIESVIEDIVEGDELDIVEEELVLETQGQPGRQAVNYFGYNIFQRDPAIFQSSVFGAVDPDYNIGPGDEIIIMLWGETQFRQVLTVDREGFVFIPEVGQVFVNGLTMDLLESKMFKVLSQRYSSLLRSNGGNATTFLDISLGNLRPLRVIVLGEVAQPGAYQVSPSTTLFSSLYYFNGPTTLGSLRDIRLIRSGKQIASIDFYDYLLSGKKINDVRLQLDDTIFLPTRAKTVTISGEINRPAIYELKEGESLQDLIRMSGGLRVSAYLDRAQIDRIVPPEERDALEMDRMFIDVDLNNVLNKNQLIELKDGDNIQIFSILDLRQNIVEISGAVVRPGRFDIGESIRLRELVLKADSLVGDAYLDRVDVVRINPDFTEKLIELNLGLAMEENPQHNIQLEPLDRVTVYGTTAMIPRKYVSISGYVKTPGRYLLRENMTLYDLIFKAGGFTDEEFLKTTYRQRAELVRVSDDSVTKEIVPFNLDLLLSKQGMADEQLKPNDAIRIYSITEIKGSTKYASISGHVKRPGQYEIYEENMTLYDLIFKAGGFTDEEWKNQTFLGRADLIRFDDDRITQTIVPFNLGEILDHAESAQNLQLLPGDEIRVYSQRVFNAEKPISITGVVKNPGQYTLKTGMSLKDLILEAGGLSETVYKYRIDIARIDPLEVSEHQYAETITLDMDETFSVSNIEYESTENPGKITQPRNGFKLQPYDYISVRPDPYFSMQRIITVNGAVFYPGDYTILSPVETISSVIERAGGLRPNAYADASMLVREGQNINLSISDAIEKPYSKHDFIVLAEDIITINVRPNVVAVFGEVHNPGLFKYLPGLSMRDYIRKAGGFTSNADRRDVWIRYASGEGKKFNRYSLFSPPVKDGAVITVDREVREEIDKTEFAKEITAILASMAQVIAIIILAQP